MYVLVYATPGAKKERVLEKEPGVLDIAIKEKALQNQANGRIREILRDRYGVSLGKVNIISGHRSPKKIISIDIDTI